MLEAGSAVTPPTASVGLKSFCRPCHSTSSPDSLSLHSDSKSPQAVMSDSGGFGGLEGFQSNHLREHLPLCRSLCGMNGSCNSAAATRSHEESYRVLQDHIRPCKPRSRESGQPTSGKSGSTVRRGGKGTSTHECPRARHGPQLARASRPGSRALELRVYGQVHDGRCPVARIGRCIIR